MDPFLLFHVCNLTRETRLPVCRCRVTCLTQTGRSTTSARWSEWARASWWMTATTALTSTSTSAGASVSPDELQTVIMHVLRCRFLQWFHRVHQTCQANRAQRVRQPVWSPVRAPLTWDFLPSSWSCSPTTGICMFQKKCSLISTD